MNLLTLQKALSSLSILILLWIIAGCEDDQAPSSDAADLDGDQIGGDASFPEEGPNGSRPMAVEQKDFAYLGQQDGIDYDALCAESYGTGWLSFFDLDQTDKYVCLESCTSKDQMKSECDTIDNVHYGVIDITSIYRCTEIDQKRVFLVTDYLHCNHACNSSNTTCD